MTLSESIYHIARCLEEYRDADIRSPEYMKQRLELGDAWSTVVRHCEPCDIQFDEEYFLEEHDYDECGRVKTVD